MTLRIVLPIVVLLALAVSTGCEYLAPETPVEMDIAGPSPLPGKLDEDTQTFACETSLNVTVSGGKRGHSRLEWTGGDVAIFAPGDVNPIHGTSYLASEMREIFRTDDVYAGNTYQSELLRVESPVLPFDYTVALNFYDRDLDRSGSAWFRGACVERER